MDAAQPLAVLGATGYTGGLVVERARELLLPLRLIGRRRDALQRVARDEDEVRVADARHEQELIDAFDGAFAVVSTTGPFMDVGTRPIAAAIAVGAHYVDHNVEQAYTRLVYEGFDESADERGVVLLPGFGLGYAVGDFAARLAAEGLDEPLDEVVVGYSAKGISTSPGTRRTAGFVMAQDAVAWDDGLVGSRFGKTTRRMRFPDGEKTVVEAAGNEPLSVPRHTRVHRVRTYVAAPRVAAFGGIVAPLFAPAARLLGPVGGAPPPEKRPNWRWTAVAEARSGVHGRRATLRGANVYELTALLLARAAEALRDGEAHATGALAPAQAFEPESFLPRLAPLLEVAGVDDI